MARARNIKPGLYKNEDLAECSIWARYLFPGLWTLADREGRLEDRPKRIKAELLPFDTIDVEKLLQELHDRGFILRYQNEDGKFIQILKFKEHQSPHYTEKPSVIKPPSLPECVGDSSPENSRSQALIKRGSKPPDSLIHRFSDSPNHESLCTDSPIPDSGKLRPPVGGADPIFGPCLDFLTGKGVKDDRARAFLGLMRKGYGDARVAEVFREAEMKDVSAPVPWIVAALKRRHGRRPANNAEAIEEARRLVFGEGA